MKLLYQQIERADFHIYPSPFFPFFTKAVSADFCSVFGGNLDYTGDSRF